MMEKTFASPEVQARAAEAMKSTVRLLACSREEAEVFPATERDVCISIRSPGRPPVRFAGRFGEVLRLWFDDIAFYEKFPGESGGRQIDDDQADMIAQFALKYRTAQRLVVHCEAGISRSVAITFAIADRLCRTWPYPSWYRAEWKQQNFVHNRPVFDAIAAAFERARV